MSIMIPDRSRVIPIDEELERKLTVKTSDRITYEEVVKLMRKGYDVFISNLPRRSAYYAKRRLTKILEENTDAWPASLDRVPGYLFTTRKGVEGRRRIARY